MEFAELIGKRRAVRAYKDSPIEQSDIQSLIDAAILAPSAMNRQPWAFAASVDPKRIDDFSSRARAWLLENTGETSADIPIHQMLEDPELALLHHAPALVLVLAKSSDRQASEDCCLAAENLMLAARDAGLGTCWIGLSRPWFDLPSTKLELGLPENYRIVAPIIVGHPKSWPEPHGRNPAEIHWIR